MQYYRRSWLSCTSDRAEQFATTHVKVIRRRAPGSPQIVPDPRTEEFYTQQNTVRISEASQKRRQLSSNQPKAGIRDAVEGVRELYHYLVTHPPIQPHVEIFKGGGYIYSDAENVLKASRLDHLFQMTNKIKDADVVVCRAYWDDNRKVDLTGHQNAASNHGVPFIVVDRFTPTQLLLHLRPLLEARGVVPAAEQKLLYRITASDQDAAALSTWEDVSTPSAHPSSTKGEHHDCAVGATELEQLQLQVLSGAITTGSFIRVSRSSRPCISWHIIHAPSLTRLAPPPPRPHIQPTCCLGLPCSC
jgi:hypothetical protein